MRYGDLLAKLAGGQQLTPGEQGELRLEGNKQEGMASQVAGWTGDGGNISSGAIPYKFVGAQVILDVASSGSQTIPAIAETVLKWTSTASQAFSYELGFDGTSGISLAGTPPGAIIQLMATIHWDANSSGYRYITIYSDLGSHGAFYVSGGNFVTQNVNWIHVVQSRERAYWLTAWQNGVAGGLDVLANSRFAVVRLR